MTQFDDTTPLAPQPAPPAAPPVTVDSTPAAPGWRQRLYGFRSVIAVAVAALVLGGLGGAALGYAANGGDEAGPGRGGFGGPQGGGFPGGAPGGQGFPGQPGQAGQFGQPNGAPGNGQPPSLPGQTAPSTAPSPAVQPDS